MHTRKSAPLPNPKDTSNQYQINYRDHYLELHKYLMRLISKEDAEKKQLIMQFTQISEDLTKVKLIYKENPEVLQKEEASIREVLQPLYEQICQKQLAMKKLFEEAQGVIYQLYDLLKEKQQEIKNVRSKKGETSEKQKLVFLHIENLHRSISETDYTKSLELNDQDDSFQRNKTNEQIGFPQTYQRILLEVQEDNIESQKHETGCIEQKDTSNKNEQLQILLPVFEEYKKEEEDQIPCAQIDLQRLPHSQKLSNIEKYAILEKKAQHRRESNKYLNGAKQCIQINSSNDDQKLNREFKGQTLLSGSVSNKNQQHILKSEKIPRTQQKPKPHRQKKPISCITILDDF